jgi:hypothetical protein
MSNFIDSLDVVPLGTIICVATTIVVGLHISISANRTKQLQRSNTGFGPVTLSPMRFVVIQLVAWTIAMVVAYALYWTPIWPISMAVSVTGPLWGFVATYSLYKVGRLPVVASLPAIVGAGMLLGNQFAILHRAAGSVSWA